jgi:hypothetical protein
MDPISIAIALAQFAPSLMRFFGAGDKATTVAEKVIGMAKSVTGAQTPEQALEMMKFSTDRQVEFNLAVLKVDSELEAAYLSDIQSARVRDIQFLQTGTRNYRADTMYFLAVIVIAGLVWVVMQSEMDEYGKGIITLVLGRFLGYLDNIYNFEFGSTRSSKDKDATIQTLVAPLKTTVITKKEDK